MTVSPLTDEKRLLQKLRERSPKAFELVYNHYWPIMFSHAMRMLQNRDDAQDAVQELFIALHNHADNLEENSSIANYLYITLRNKILNTIRKQKYWHEYVETLTDFAEQTNNHILETIEEKEVRGLIQEEINRMPPRMREVFEMSRYDNLTHKEIAEKLKISDKTVKSQVHQALKLLRSKLYQFLFVLF